TDILVTSIKINGRAVPLNMSLLDIGEDGNGGTKISTVDPYTVMETSIFEAVLKVFMEETKGVTRIPSVEPFKYCISSKNLGSARVGPPVPSIDLGLHDESVSWRIFGVNSMMHVKDVVLCLGFVDGGSNPRTSVVIGGHQLEDNLLEFDLVKRRLGFISTLLFMQTTCANFNSTSSVKEVETLVSKKRDDLFGQLREFEGLPNSTIYAPAWDSINIDTPDGEIVTS
ncbi:probable aspartic proteinase GIP2, partial [Rhodamnia argentea]|uniref:Probable aspartic proteinase GIP2 n=1 Tax=Rhodamnia argentea TaxID=178133 RepID=A0ABM3HHJ5_9MYRT